MMNLLRTAEFISPTSPQAKKTLWSEIVARNARKTPKAAAKVADGAAAKTLKNKKQTALPKTPKHRAIR